MHPMRCIAFSEQFILVFTRFMIIIWKWWRRWRQYGAVCLFKYKCNQHWARCNIRIQGIHTPSRDASNVYSRRKKIMDVTNTDFAPIDFKIEGRYESLIDWNSFKSGGRKFDRIIEGKTNMWILWADRSSNLHEPYFGRISFIIEAQ